MIFFFRNFHVNDSPQPHTRRRRHSRDFRFFSRISIKSLKRTDSHLGCDNNRVNHSTSIRFSYVNNSIKFNFISRFSHFITQFREATAYVSEVINSLGELSARAQGLNQPVTTTDRLRSSDDQFVYLLTEENDKK